METGRPTLTQRRRAATESEIVYAAIQLFVRQGLAATTVEQIASQAGVSLRTFYRYFPSKQEAVVPLLTRGAEHWQGLLAQITSTADLRVTVTEVVRGAMTPVDERSIMDRELSRPLLRVVLSDPDLLRVWDTVNGDSERALLGIFTDLVGTEDPLTPRLLAAAATHAIRIALETWAAPGAPDEISPGDLAAESFRRLSAWLDRPDLP
jgi:AcrR family transcriptional regulator